MTRTAITESVSLCERMKKLTAFLELERVMRRRNVFNLQGIEQQIAIAGTAF
jgi:hypothetical protein